MAATGTVCKRGTGHKNPLTTAGEACRLSGNFVDCRKQQIDATKYIYACKPPPPCANTFTTTTTTTNTTAAATSTTTAMSSTPDPSPSTVTSRKRNNVLEFMKRVRKRNKFVE